MTTHGLPLLLHFFAALGVSCRFVVRHGDLLVSACRLMR